MTDIPMNPHQRNFQAEVDKAVEEMLKSMGSGSGHREGGLSLNHGESYFHVMNDVAAVVADRFKKKGYHAHYCYSIRGVAYALKVTTYPTNNDI